jgi:hypothetical protein
MTPELRKALIWKKYIVLENRDIDEFPNSCVCEADEKLALFETIFPRGGPYVLTHFDLDPHNIFVSGEFKPGEYKISAIIDWEKSGFAPWWVQGFYTWDLGDVGMDWMLPDLPDGGVQKWNEIRELVGPMIDVFTFASGVFQHTPRGANNWDLRDFCACGGSRKDTGWRDDLDFAIPEEHVHLF